MRRITFLLAGLMIIGRTFAQVPEDSPYKEPDTIRTEHGMFTITSASEYIIDLLGKNNLWRTGGDTMKLSLTRLIHHFNEPFDSVRNRLSVFNYDSVKLRHTRILKNDTIPLKWLNDSSFIVNEPALEREPLILQRTIIKPAIDTSALDFKELPAEIQNKIDSLLHEEKTISEIVIDTLFLESKRILIHKLVKKAVIPPLVSPGSHKSARFFPDSSKIIISDTISAIVADRKSPFYIVPGIKMLDSLRLAVKTLLTYTEKRDSILVFISDINGRKTPFWLTTGNDELYRYWVRNYKNDSITIWMGNPAKNDITLILEEDVNVNRMTKERSDDIPVTTVKPRISLAKIEPLNIIPVYWNQTFSSTFGLNETWLSNWVKGGESNLTGLLDIKAASIYTNTEANTQWTSSGRLNYGAIITKENGYRTNNDMFELNSQFNKLIKNKFDFSTVLNLKSQIAHGYKYPNDSVIVSRFLNPGIFGIGTGVEYKPGKKTKINFSPLWYQNTFVFDTAQIDQTRYGIKKDKRAKQEMGGRLSIKNTISILDGLNISNVLLLFSGYLDKPENIDVDWEINVEKKIKWYFKIILNLHAIYDDDIRVVVLDKNDKPVLLPDGKKKESPKIQFKEFLGLAFTF